MSTWRDTARLATLATVAERSHNVRMAGAVEPRAGRTAANIIKTAQDRLVLTAGAAAKLAGITDVGWARVIKAGRGYPATFIAMARVVGVEPQVRAALGLPALDANVIPMPVPAESAEDAALRDVMYIIRHESPQLTDHEREVALAWLRRPEARERVRAELAEAVLALARQG
jgi:hypothetical protein